MTTVTAENGETLWAVMKRVEGQKAGNDRYRLWREANPDIGETQMGGGELVNVPGKDE